MNAMTTRRQFTAAMGAAGAACAMGAAKALADPTTTGENAGAADDNTPSELTGWAGTPERIFALGGSTMPLADLNQRRHAYVDAQTDFTCEDGTVVPAAYVKMRALIHTYGQGSGNSLTAFTYSGIMDKFTEEEALAYTEMPYGVRFTALDFQAESGRSLEECTELCELFAKEGWLERYESPDGLTYHHIGFFQGVEEYPFDYIVFEDPTWLPGIEGADLYEDFATSGTPNFVSVPVSRDVVEDEVLPLHDDIESFIRGKSRYAVAPCLCRWMWVRDNCPDADLPSFESFLAGEHPDYRTPEIENFHVETCLQVGDEASYWIWKGMAREVTEDEAVSILKRSADDGMILHSLFNKDHGTICSCHADSHCLICDFYTAMGSTPDEVAAAPAFQQVSHYLLDVDLDSCIACGACEARCPLHAITMDGQDGKPRVNGRCERCGQCALVCPQKARKLTRRPEEDILELPATHLDDYNLKGAYRFEKGLIK